MQHKNPKTTFFHMGSVHCTTNLQPNGRYVFTFHRDLTEAEQNNGTPEMNQYRSRLFTLEQIATLHHLTGKILDQTVGVTVPKEDTEKAEVTDESSGQKEEDKYEE